jgi:tRNA G18 (ribose-2'-O)-methylase SpoU
MDRVPFQATAAGAVYERIRSLPVSILLDNVRSLYNVGSFFRTADAAGVDKLYLCGITGRPPKSGITKTALGAEESVPWEHTWDPVTLLGSIRERGCEIAAIETSMHAIDLFDWAPRFRSAWSSAMRSMGCSPKSRRSAIPTSAYRCSGRSIR